MRGIILKGNKKLTKKNVDKKDKDKDENKTYLAGYFKSGENYIGHLSRKTKRLARILEKEKKNQN